MNPMLIICYDSVSVVTCCSFQLLDHLSYDTLMSVPWKHNHSIAIISKLKHKKYLIKTLMTVNTRLLTDIVNEKNWGFGETVFKIYSGIISLSINLNFFNNWRFS